MPARDARASARRELVVARPTCAAVRLAKHRRRTYYSDRVERKARKRGCAAMNEHGAGSQDRQRLLEIVGRIWSTLLGTQQVAPHAHFFGLGGDSLKATELMLRIQDELAISLDPIEVFDAPVLEDFVAVLASMVSDHEKVDEVTL